jgi:hypothetical protein
MDARVDSRNTRSHTDARVYPPESCHWMPASQANSGVGGYTPNQWHMPDSIPLLDGPAFGMPWALMRLVNGALDDILHWQGGGDCSKAVDGTLELTDKDLFSLGLDD